MQPANKYIDLFLSRLWQEKSKFITTQPGKDIRGPYLLLDVPY